MAHSQTMTVSTKHAERFAAGQSLALQAFCPPSVDPSGAIVEARHSIFPPQIEAGDMLCIDFTHTTLTHDSLYVVAFTDMHWGPWIGIRRFQLTASGWQMSDDVSGDGPTVLSAATLQNLQVIGRIKQVYAARSK